MFSPSGDHRGVVTAGPPKEVNCTAFKPSLSHTQISPPPERSEKKAIFFPSGENWGLSSRHVEAMNVSGRPVLAFGLGNSRRQMFESVMNRRKPDGFQAGRWQRRNRPRQPTPAVGLADPRYDSPEAVVGISRRKDDLLSVRGPNWMIGVPMTEGQPFRFAKRLESFREGNQVKITDTRINATAEHQSPAVR